MLKKVLRYTVVYIPELGGGFTVSVPKLPGCVTYGKNFEQAQEMVKDAIKLYLESLQKHKESIPLEKRSALVGEVDLELPNLHA